MRRALLLVAFGASAAAWADTKHPNPFLSQAKVFATQGEGDKCLKRLLQAEQKWKWNDKRDRAEIEMYGGICGYLVGETQAAEVSFKNAVKIDPKLELPKDLGPGIEGLWTRATGKAVASPSSGPGLDKKKDESKKQPEKPAVAEAPPPKKDEPAPSKVEPARDAHREPTADQKLDQQLSTEAEAPPAKKGRNIVLPIGLGVVGIGAGVTGMVFGLQARSAEARFKSLDTYYVDAQSAATAARTDALVANIMFAAAGALVIAAVLAFVLSG